MNTKKYALAASLALIALVLPRVARASSITFDPTSFGVGAAFGQLVSPITGANFMSGVTSTSTSGVTENLDGNYTLTANLNDPTTGLPQIGAMVTNSSNNANVVIADGFSMTGASAIASFTITGSFSTINPVVADTGVTIGIGTYADFLNCKNTPGCVSAYSSSITIECCPTGAGGEFRVRGGTFAPWTGSFTFNVPVTPADNGFVLEWSGDASGDHPTVTDFLHTTTVSFTPSPGGSVTLATGQVFTAPITAPEPSSLLLLGTGLLALAGMTWRKRLFA